MKGAGLGVCPHAEAAGFEEQRAGTLKHLHQRPQVCRQLCRADGGASIGPIQRFLARMHRLTRRPALLLHVQTGCCVALQLCPLQLTVCIQVNCLEQALQAGLPLCLSVLASGGGGSGGGGSFCAGSCSGCGRWRQLLQSLRPDKQGQAAAAAQEEADGRADAAGQSGCSHGWLLGHCCMVIKLNV
jgi:hypothetical protein